MKLILPVLFFVLVSIAGFIGLWKFNKWLRPLTTGELILDNGGKENVDYIIHKRGIILSLIFVWILTLVSGMIGIWKYITAPLLISISALLTICCVISIVKNRHCTVSLGICSIYLGHLCLIAAFKIGYWQFAISYWWLIGAIVFNILISLLVVLRFIKKGKQIKKSHKKKIISFTALGIAVTTYPIVSALGRFMKQNNVGNDVAVPIVMICLSLFALATPFTAHYLVLDLWASKTKPVTKKH